MANLTDEIKLLEDFRKGSVVAFETIYKTHKYSVQAIALYVLQDTDDAVDVVQDVFKSLWANKEKLHLTGPISNYLIKSGKNRALDILKSKSRKRSHYLDPVYQNQQSSEKIIEKLEKHDLINIINKALNRIESRFMREAFRLVHIEGMNYKEVSKVLGISISTSRTYVYKVSKQLKELLKNNGHY